MLSAQTFVFPAAAEGPCWKMLIFNKGLDLALFILWIFEFVPWWAVLAAQVEPTKYKWF